MYIDNSLSYKTYKKKKKKTCEILIRTNYTIKWQNTKIYQKGQN